MRALITGLTGFVGGHLVEHCRACGDEVAGVARCGDWGDGWSSAHSRTVPIFAADLSVGIPPDLHGRIADWRPDVVYHLAAMSVPADCGADEPTAAAIAANVDATRVVADLVASLTPAPRLVFSSSCYVYGIVPQDRPVVSEDSPCEPYSGYGVTKLAAEQILRSAAAQRGLDVVIARAFQHTGPRQPPRMIVPEWSRQLLEDRPDPIRVICLDTFLDLSDVRDIVRAYRDLARAGRPGRIYNVGSGVCRRGGDLLDLLQQITNAARPVVELAPGRRQHPIADISRIQGEVGWRPEIPIEQTLRDVVDDWRNKIGATR